MTTVLPWRSAPPGGPAVATGIGSLPGTDPLAAARAVWQQCPDLPYLPELPERGPGADLVGRAAALLVDLAVDLQPSGWRLVGRPGVDHRRARDMWSRDLDAVEQAADGWSGPLKVAVAGPWTLAAALELSSGEKALRDHGAVADLAASLTAGLVELVAALRRRVPGAQLVVQLDEPSLPAVLAARVPTASGWGTLRAPDPVLVRDRLATLIGGLEAPVGVHCCAPSAPLRLVREAGASFLAVDVTQLARPELDALGEAADAGLDVLLGVVPSIDVTPTPHPDDLAGTVARLWARLGLDPEQLADRVVVTPTCGLAGATPAWVSTAHRLARETASEVSEHPEPRAGSHG